ncbi:hypothetical protein TRFO_37369 [Tritrichomonas foetus]|uniref:Uncharacterized protein n=1 Tax=Tritrichomonas foetus TaxID=1144522 RepID=A0A1J4JG73_9EUKA|nr:hypothetical protein TRFO_37369 [Tritrichomonas foetus]|eukprot:OHS96453.1 hypothetical protein TRFO_37369 [Tritrichomonas foetus]
MLQHQSWLMQSNNESSDDEDWRDPSERLEEAHIFNIQNAQERINAENQIFKFSQEGNAQLGDSCDSQSMNDTDSQEACCNISEYNNSSEMSSPSIGSEFSNNDNDSCLETFDSDGFFFSMNDIADSDEYISDQNKICSEFFSFDRQDKNNVDEENEKLDPDPGKSFHVTCQTESPSFNNSIDQNVSMCNLDSQHFRQMTDQNSQVMNFDPISGSFFHDSLFMNNQQNSLMVNQNIGQFNNILLTPNNVPMIQNIGINIHQNGLNGQFFNSFPTSNVVFQQPTKGRQLISTRGISSNKPSRRRKNTSATFKDKNREDPKRNSIYLNSQTDEVQSETNKTTFSNACPCGCLAPTLTVSTGRKSVEDYFVKVLGTPVRKNELNVLRQDLFWFLPKMTRDEKRSREKHLETLGENAEAVLAILNQTENVKKVQHLAISLRKGNKKDLDSLLCHIMRL